MSASSSRTLLIALLFMAAVIGYVDRGSMSIAMPAMAAQFHFSPSQKGWMLGSFFISYAMFQVFAGYLIDRFSVRWVFAAGFALWSVATVATGLAQSVTALLLPRLALGVGESFMFPAFAKLVSVNFPPEARGLPNSVLDAGTKIGPALGVFAGALLIGGYGWRVMFYLTGACSLLWLVPWVIWGPSEDIGQQTVAAVAQRIAAREPPGIRAILSCRDAWGTFIGASCYTYAYFFLLTWLPSYLVDVRHLSMTQLGVIGSAPYLASACAAVLAGWYSDRLIRRGYSVTLVRKSFVAVGLMLSISALPAAGVQDVRQSILLLILAYIALGIFASNLWTISQTLSGSRAAGKWAGLQNCLGASSGIAAPVITGYLIEATGSYRPAFLLTACLAIVGTLSYVFIVQKIEAVDWTPVSAASVPPHRRIN